MLDAKLKAVVDGDTIKVLIRTEEKGFEGIEGSILAKRKITLRLEEVDTHETHFVDKDSKEYKKGIKETKWVLKWLKNAEKSYDKEYPLKIEISKEGKYGRQIAKVVRKYDGEELNQAILNEFNDVSYN